MIEFSRLRDAVGVPPVDTNKNIDQETAQEATLKDVCRKLDGVTILQKGAVDLICDGNHLLRCDVEGGPRRSGGLGDILAGTLGIVYAWAIMASAANDTIRVKATKGQEHLWAAQAACSIARSSCAAAFEKEKRATTVRKATVASVPELAWNTKRHVLMPCHRGTRFC